MWFTIPTVTLIADLYQACLFSKGKEVPSRPFYAIRRSGNKRLFISPSSHLFYKKSDFELFKAFHLLTVTYPNAQPKPQENLSITKVKSITWGPCRTRLRPWIQKNSQKVAGGCPPTVSPTQKLKSPFLLRNSRVYGPFRYHFEWFQWLFYSAF